jgi:hypothetical protein
MNLALRSCPNRSGFQLPVYLLPVLLAAGSVGQQGNAADVRPALDPKEIVQDFRPTQPHGNILSKLQGTIWIDSEDYTWVKVDGKAIGTISLGFFLARIHEGSRFSFEQVRLNNEIWLMRRLHADASARVLLLSNRAVDLDETFSHYQKFTTRTKILPGVSEVQPQ